MKVLIVLMLFLLTGCTTVQVPKNYFFNIEVQELQISIQAEVDC